MKNNSIAQTLIKGLSVLIAAFALIPAAFSDDSDLDRCDYELMTAHEAFTMRQDRAELIYGRAQRSLDALIDSLSDGDNKLLRARKRDGNDNDYEVTMVMQSACDAAAKSSNRRPRFEFNGQGAVVVKVATDPAKESWRMPEIELTLTGNRAQDRANLTGLISRARSDIFTRKSNGRSELSQYGSLFKDKIDFMVRHEQVSPECMSYYADPKPAFLMTAAINKPVAVNTAKVEESTVFKDVKKICAQGECSNPAPKKPHFGLSLKTIN